MPISALSCRSVRTPTPCRPATSGTPSCSTSPSSWRSSTSSSTKTTSRMTTTCSDSTTGARRCSLALGLSELLPLNPIFFIYFILFLYYLYMIYSLKSTVTSSQPWTFNPLVPKAHNSECQNLLFPLQKKHQQAIAFFSSYETRLLNFINTLV